ncbi:helix-turn-helix transcriptional regulator [Variovorax sp. dw_308]|uniref:helix-turn-helix transcriptional regulator n=1 Tax=Variovorax sp. dw_308 TaxID=2721546 RepID=UPI001C4733C5|nr:helix-turn-helix transcriptional regulator [Variovorax sp. dw_308]
MRSWKPDPASTAGNALADTVFALGEGRFGETLLGDLRDTLPVNSVSVYRTGTLPAIFLSASLGVPDTTRDCWRAYLSGPVAVDRTLRPASDGASAPEAGLRLCHITAPEVPAEHRAKVYDAHGVAERVSVVQEESDRGIFAVNFYRHQHQRPLSDGQLAEFGRLGGLLMALARKHIALAQGQPQLQPLARMSDRLRLLQPDLTAREIDVCVRLLQGMTQEGIAADLGLGVPTVKTYRNRAFGRLGIHFRNELFALMLERGAS